ncbi:hypothetical protein RDV89_15830 [Nocardioides zeae]|uniref:Uncharacterized protein n=1 Tax=Nocardioides imazamoxiresistens TaxID=3231893 RepID=A0ABU3PZH8_9ACTN|nr:hypothetical protein [Nocardioides zeae]MDT9594554.1 hypothetical protein [Nocardioides zeae]
MVRRTGRWADAPYDAVVLLSAVVVLGPALGVGLVLGYDMVWVPDLAVTREGWGLADGVPRAVPSDQVVALLDEVVPGALLQKLVLLGSLVAAGAGLHRLVRTAPAAARALAAVVAVWNPFVAERLAIGHWPLLVAYGVLPWLLLVGRRLRTSGHTGLRPVLPVLPVLLALGSLSAAAGLMTALAALVAVGVGGRLRRSAAWALVALVAAANAPWVVAGALAGGATRADAATARAAAEAFAAHGHDGVPTAVAVLGLGGVWNGEVAAPYDVVRALLWAGLVLGALGSLVPLLRAGSGRRRETAVLLALAGAGVAVAAQSWLFPQVGGALATYVPGGGVLRDATRLQALVVPGVVEGAAVAVAVGARRLRATAAPARAVLGVAVVLAPVALLPGLAWGRAGELAAVRLPAAYADLAAVVAADARAQGLARPTVLSLPYAAFRAPDLNDGRTVLDPVPRLLGDVGVLASDELVVDGRAVGSEGSRTGDVLAALGRPTAADRTAALAELGVDYVVRARGADVDAAVAATGPLDEVVVADAPALTVTRLVPGGAETAVEPVPTWDAAWLAVAWTVYASLPLLALGALSAQVRRASRPRPGSAARGPATRP